MLYVYRFRLYPTKEQIEFLNRQIGHCRFIYNKLLEIAKEGYERKGKKWNYYEYKKLLPELKKEFPFLKEANSQSLQEAVKWLDRAFKNFFKGLAKFPKFKSKKRVNSISIPQHFCIEENRIKIPKLKTRLIPFIHLPNSVLYVGIRTKISSYLIGSGNVLTVGRNTIETITLL